MLQTDSSNDEMFYVIIWWRTLKDVFDKEYDMNLSRTITSRQIPGAI
jgi:hypothetical protein